MDYTKNDRTLIYHTFGAGRPILLIHGFSVDHHLMTGCLEPIFADRTGWQRFYPDLPGMGQTPAQDSISNSDDILDLLLDFIDDELPSNEPFVLGGSSYGGYLAQGIVQHMPERVAGLLLMNPMTVVIHEERQLPAHAVFEQDGELLASLDPVEREGFTTFQVIQTREVWERSLREIQVGLALGDQAFLEHLQRPENYAFSFELAPTLAKPALIVTGRQDSATGYRDVWPILENFPRASFAVLDRAGHNLPIEQAALFSVLIAEWLDRVEAELD